MADPLPNRMMARLACAFMIMASCVGAATLVLDPAPEGVPRLRVLSISTALMLGVLGWFAPWDRWPRGALFAFVPPAMALKGLSSFATAGNPYTFSIHYLVLFMWIGLALPSWGWVASLPFFALAYLAPTLLLDRPDAVRSLPSVITAMLFVGAAASWLSGRLRSAERESELRAERMSRLVDATVALASSQEVGELARLTALGAIDVYGGRGALVLLESQGALHRVGEASWPAVLGPGEPDGDCLEAIRRWLASEEEPRPAADPSGWLARRLGVPRVEAIPLEGAGGALGAAVVALDATAPRSDKFTDYVARSLATQAGLGFERVLSQRALLDDSLRDPLTGIGNRRKATHALELLKPADVVAVIDLDRFKRVNDTYGHAAGDRVLRSLAEFLRSSVRGPDEVYRYGGEEFLVVLQGGSDDAARAVERIHGAWSCQRRVTTFSAGVAVHRDGEPPEDTLARADAALYEAKRLGRDRVVVDAQARPTRRPPR